MSLNLSPPYKVLVSLPATMCRHYMVKPNETVPESPSGTPGWALGSQEGSGVEILLKKLVWLASAAEANFRNICPLSTSRACVETS